MPRRKSKLKRALLLLPLVLLAACQAMIPRVDNFCEDELGIDGVSSWLDSSQDPYVSKSPSIHSIACDLDHLEKHIDWYGSVTAKIPDIWGQARLTRYREEIEQQMESELKKFKVYMNGQVTRADQAYLVNALTLSLAAKPATPAKANSIPDFPAKVENLPPNTLKTADIIESNIGLEPVVILDQKKRYLEHLAQIRRNNEGDDTADSPGYTLNLMRIPVSVLPGKRTASGHGAEITFTVDPVISDELLPTTFRSLIANDLVNQFSFPLAKSLSNETNRELINDNVTRAVMRERHEVKAMLDQFYLYLNHCKDNNECIIESKLMGIAKNNISQRLVDLLDIGKIVDSIKVSDIQNKLTVALILYAATISSEVDIGSMAERSKDLSSDVATGIAFIENLIGGGATGNLNSIPFSTGGRFREPLPASQYFEVYGTAFPFEVAYQVNKALGSEFDANGYAHLPDIQSFLRTEIDAAYRFLSRPEHQVFWERFCTEEMARLVHTRNGSRLREERRAFRDMFAEVSESPRYEASLEEQSEFSSTAGLVWALLVDAALLNERLMLDMKETAASKNVVLPCDQWHPFYLPNPPAETRAVFAEYVKARWPVHVFALDPETNDQNIVDSLSTRREIQLALSIAFASGHLNANQFSRFVRRLDAQYETIALNRTQIGFSHGNDTFGWRFYPRFQTPGTRSNLVTIARDQVIGGPTTNQLLRERRMEPGPRECTALVIMPAFISSVQLDVVSNWFGLANPKRKVFDHTQAMKLSRRVQALRTDGWAAHDSYKYRDGDHRLLLARAEQLSNRLPLQTMTTSVPTNDNLSGFELFSNGTSSLAPQLYGWYGAPGIVEGKETTLFLVGDYFSVSQSRVLIGNQPAKNKEMISRQVMKVVVPKEAIPRSDGKIQIHVATPYGVSQELLVNVVKPREQKRAAEPANVVVNYDKRGNRGTDGKFDLVNAEVPQRTFGRIGWPNNRAPSNGKVKLVFKYKDCPIEMEKTGQVYGDQIYFDNKVLEEIAAELFKQLKPFGPFSDDMNPLKDGFKTDSIYHMVSGSKVESLNGLVLKFKCNIYREGENDEKKEEEKQPKLKPKELDCDKKPMLTNEKSNDDTPINRPEDDATSTEILPHPRKDKD